MIDDTDIEPKPIRGNREQFEADNTPPVMPQDPGKQHTDWLDLTSAALSESSLTTALTNRFLTPQPDFKAIPGFKALGNVPKGYEANAEDFVGAESPEEIEWRRQQVDNRNMNRRIIAEHGVYGFAATLAGGLTDPLTLASMAIPLGGEARMANILRSGAVAAGASGAQEVGFHALDPTRQLDESLTNVGMSAVVGGVFGALMKSKIPRAEMDRLSTQLDAEVRSKEKTMADSPTLGPVDGRTSIDPMMVEHQHLTNEIQQHLAEHEANLHGQATGKEAFAVDIRADQGETLRRLEVARADLNEVSKPLMEDRNTQIEAEMDRLRRLSPEATEAEMKAKGETRAVVMSLAELKAHNAAELERTALEGVDTDLAKQRAATNADREELKRQIFARNREGTAPWDETGQYPKREVIEPEAKPAEGVQPKEESPQEKALRKRATDNVQQTRDRLTLRASKARNLIDSLSFDADRARRVMSARSSLSVLREHMAAAQNINDKASLLPEGLRQHYEARLAEVGKALNMKPEDVAKGLPDVPTTMADDPQMPFINPSGESTAGAAAYVPTLESEGLAKGANTYAKLVGFVSPKLRLITSPNIVSRQIVQKLVNFTSRLEKNYHNVASPQNVEANLWLQDGVHFQAIDARSKHFQAYKDRLKAAGIPTMDRNEFGEQVSKAMRRGDAHDIPEVAQAAKDTRRIAWDPLKQRAIKWGLLPKDVDPKFADSYLMRQYDQAKIRANMTEWTELLVKGFMKQGVEGNDALSIAYKVTRNIQGGEYGLMDYKIMDGVMPTSGRLKDRTLSLPDTMLEKFLNNDINGLEHAYIRSLAPELEFHDQFDGDPKMGAHLQDMRDEYARQILRAPDDKTKADLLKRQDNDERDIAALQGRLYGVYGQPKDPGAFGVRAGRMLRSFNATRLLGMAGLSHLPDVANVMMRYGAINTMAAAAKMLSSGEAMSLSRSSAKRVSAAVDMTMNTMSAMLGDYTNHSQWKPQQIMNRVTRAYTISTLETPIITMVQNLTSTMAQDELVRMAQKAASGEALSSHVAARLASGGIDSDMLQKIAGQASKYGQNVNGLNFGMSHLWDDQAAAHAFETVMAREAHSVTLRPSVGDTPLFMSTEWGKTIMQFKSFGFAATEQVTAPLLQGITHGDPRAMTTMAALIGMGTMSYMLKQKAAGRPIEEWNSPRLAGEILDKSNLLGWTGEYVFPMANQLGFKSMSRFSDRDPIETLGGASAGAIGDAFSRALPGRALAPLRNTLTGENDAEDPGMRRSDLHFLRKMAPAQNNIFLRNTINGVEDRLGDAFNLPGKSNAERAAEDAGVSK